VRERLSRLAENVAALMLAVMFSAFLIQIFAEISNEIRQVVPPREIENIIEDGDMVVLEFTGRGTHTGPLRTPMGEFDPTDKPLVLKLCDVWTFSSDGTPTELRTYFDSGSMMAQLGLTPQMAGATA